MAGDNKNTPGAGTGAGAGAPETVTLESLASKVAEQTVLIAAQDLKIETQNGIIEEQNGKIANLVLLIGEGKTSAAGAGKAELPTIPTELLEHKGKVKPGTYKWNVAAFSLPGSPEVFTAAEASVTPGLVDRLLKIEGQKALQLQA